MWSPYPACMLRSACRRTAKLARQKPQIVAYMHLPCVAVCCHGRLAAVGYKNRNNDKPADARTRARARINDRATTLSFALAPNSCHKSVFGRKRCSPAVVRRCCRNVSVFAADICVFQQKAQSAANFPSDVELHNRNAVKLACRDRVHISAACRAFWLYNAACAGDEHSLPLGDILTVRRRLCRVRRRPCAADPRLRGLQLYYPALCDT